MKVMSARDAKNRFGEFLDTARREPVVVTKNQRPVAIMISVEDAADTLIPELFMDKEPGYEDWLFGKVTKTLARADAGNREARAAAPARLGKRRDVEAVAGLAVDGGDLEVRILLDEHHVPREPIALFRP